MLFVLTSSFFRMHFLLPDVFVAAFVLQLFSGGHVGSLFVQGYSGFSYRYFFLVFSLIIFLLQWVQGQTHVFTFFASKAFCFFRLPFCSSYLGSNSLYYFVAAFGGLDGCLLFSISIFQIAPGFEIYAALSCCILLSGWGYKKASSFWLCHWNSFLCKRHQFLKVHSLLNSKP